MTSGPLPGIPTVDPNATKKTDKGPYGFGDVGHMVVTGASNFIGIANPYAASAFMALGIPGVTPQDVEPSLTVNQLWTKFLHARPEIQGAIQDQLYRAGGYYPSTFIPNRGHLREEDFAAFKSFLFGHVANPQAGKIGDDLKGQAEFGDSMGVNLRKRAPLVITVAHPDDIRAVIHKAALDLYGGDLNEEQTQQFINTFQQQQIQEQTGRYNAGDYSMTGDTYGPGGIVQGAPGGAGLALEAEQAIRQAHPEQVFVSGLGKTLGAMLPGLLGPGSGMLSG